MSQALLEPSEAFGAYSTVENGLRCDFLLIESSNVHSGIDPIQLVQKSTIFLEFVSLGVHVRELLTELGVPNVAASGKPVTYFADRIHEMLGMTPAHIVQQAREHLGLPEPPRASAKYIGLPATIRFLNSLVEACPIDGLEGLASHHGIENWGHRCRAAYEALRAFIYRHDPHHRAVVKVVGHQYMQGALSFGDVCTLLSLQPADAADLLERSGFARSLERLKLDSEGRTQILAQMRIERLSGTHPRLTQLHAIRDAIASERLEGIDARRWLFTSE